MNVVVTGGAGFLGQLLVRALLARGSLPGADDATRSVQSITVVDQVEGALRDARIRSVVGDVSDAALLAAAVTPDTGAVFHLAAVVSGTAEADFDLGMKVNLDGTRALLSACRTLPAPARMVFSSSVAVFGGDLPAVVTDDTTPTPQTSYGTQKLIGELLVADHTRKGYVDGRSVRLPTICVRPGRPNGAASGFASGIIREPLAGIEAICPVDPGTEMWIASPGIAVGALIRAAELPTRQWTGPRVLNLPGLTVSVGDMVESLRRASGEAVAARVRWQADETIRAIVRTWPSRFETARADAMGFAPVRDFDAILREYIGRPAGR